jgi:hypothetical protein
MGRALGQYGPVSAPTLIPTPTPEPTPSPTVESTPAPSPDPVVTPLPVDIVTFDWGSVAEWVAAVAALLAVAGAAVSLIFSALAVRASQRANNITLAAYEADVKQRSEAQARFVYSTTLVLGQIAPGQPVYTDGDVAFPGGLAHADSSGGWIGGAEGLTVKITLHNGSDELIGPFSIGVYDYESGKTAGGNMRMARRDPILPGETYSTSFGVATRHSRGHLLRGDIIFRDSSGTAWRRRGAEPIEEYTDDMPWNGLTGVNR